MPKDCRLSSIAHRTAPITSPADANSGVRVTSIWTAEDDDSLMAARASGLNWQLISKKRFPTKTANACRKRHERLMERRNTGDWDGEKLETLASHYMVVRREMWILLADRIGEKWQMVESKCMEKGIKNLQTSYKSAQRKERGMEDRDSGVGCSSAEAQKDVGVGESSRTGALPESTMTMGNQKLSGHVSIQSMLSPSPPASHGG